MEINKSTTAAPEYHGHPNYFLVFIALIVLFAVSLALGYLPNHTLAIALIFVLAVAKTYLVAGFFMHLKYEVKVLFWAVLLPIVLIIWMLIAFIYEGMKMPVFN